MDEMKRDPSKKQAFRDIKNKIKSLIKKARKEQTKEDVEKAKENKKTLWSVVDKILPKRQNYCRRRSCPAGLRPMCPDAL